MNPVIFSFPQSLVAIMSYYKLIVLLYVFRSITSYFNFIHNDSVAVDVTLTHTPWQCQEIPDTKDTY